MRGTDARRMAILEMARDDSLVRVSELSQRFGVSQVSIRRDLEKLAEYGLLKRVHGGAVAVRQEAGEESYGHKLELHLEEKRRIAHAAVGLIRPRDRVILDSGTTVLNAAQEIAQHAGELKRLTVITASWPVFRELAPVRDINLIILGGIYLPDYQTLVGPQTVAGLHNLHVDRLFLGADGLSLHSGVTTSNVLEAEVSRAMVRAADQVTVLADSSKIDNVGFTTIVPISQIHQLITDDGAPADFVDALREQGVEVILAGQDGSGVPRQRPMRAKNKERSRL
jgi:DeoR family fructose operon transcriptional repressor